MVTPQQTETDTQSQIRVSENHRAVYIGVIIRRLASESVSVVQGMYPRVLLLIKITQEVDSLKKKLSCVGNSLRALKLISC